MSLCENLTETFPGVTSVPQNDKHRRWPDIIIIAQQPAARERGSLSLTSLDVTGLLWEE